MAGGLAVASAAGYSAWNKFDALPEPESPYVIADEPDDTGAFILVLAGPNADNPFGAYLAELLRAEGILGYTLMSWDELGGRSLDEFAVVVLAEGPLNAMQVDQIKWFVFKGGQLIAFRPDGQLADLLGLQPAGGEVAGGYWLAETGHPTASGLGARAMQFHGAATYYQPTGAAVVAWLADANDQPAAYPAVTIGSYGKGQAACWSFDLARSVALIRQGNPQWANQERDGRLGIRAVDAFVGWMDLDRLDIPHADEAMRLLGRMITEMAMERLPLPRLGYFPDGRPGVLVATGDSHQNAPGTIEQVLAVIERYGGRMSVYHTTPLSSKLRRMIQRGRAELADVPVAKSIVARNLNFPTPEQVAAWRQRGHEFGLHPYVEEGLESGWKDYQQSFIGYGYGPISPTARTHRILWDGWVETARVQAAHGIRMNMDFYHYGTAFQKESGEWVYGLFNGSGLPMKFVDAQGRILNIYQQVTQLVDEHLMKLPWGGGWVGLDGDQSAQVAENILQHAAQVGAAISAQYHIDLLAFEAEFVEKAMRFMEGSLEAAVGVGFPIWTAEAWYRFTEARQRARMTGWTADRQARRMEFTLDADAAGESTLEVLLPQQWQGSRLDQVWVDGAQTPVTAKRHAGLQYAAFLVSLGKRLITAQYRENPA